MTEQTDYFANHARARQFPWTLYHAPLERDLARFLGEVPSGDIAGSSRDGSGVVDVLVVGCGLLHELDAAPPGLRYTVVDIDERAVEAVRSLGNARISDARVVPPETPIDASLGAGKFAAIYAKEVVEHVLAWPVWLAGLRRALVPGGRLWLSTPNYGEPWLPAVESTILELIARRSGFSRRHIHPTRFSRDSLARGVRAAGFEDVAAHVTPTRLAITVWARAPHGPE